MARTGWRLTRLISKMGIKGGQEFDLVPAVQPVLPVGTIGSGLTYPLYAPSGMCGKFLLTPANGALFEVQALGDGGAIIESFALGGTPAAGTRVLWRFIVSDTSIMTAPTSITVQPIGDDPPRSTVKFEDAAPPATDGYLVTVNAGDSIAFPGPVHVPNGWYFSAWASVAVQEATFGVRFQDVTVQEPML